MTYTDAPQAPALGVPVDHTVRRLVPERDNFDGQWGTSDSPNNCTECGAEWSSGERLHTGDELGQLPEADGSAEHNKERHPDGGYTYDEVPAWSESMVRAYAAEQVAAERERWRGFTAHCLRVVAALKARMTPEQVVSWTELFANHYYHGMPFQRAALEAVWRECRRDGCNRARQEAGALLGDAPSAVAGR